MLATLRALAGALFVSTNAAFAQDSTPLLQYLDSVNYAFVSFEGKLTYDEREDDFRIRIEGSFFNAVVDAGRNLRERVQDECGQVFFGSTGGCAVVGEGTVEIRGSSLWVSIESLSSIEKAE